MNNILNSFDFFKYYISLILLSFCLSSCSNVIVKHGMVSYLYSSGKESIVVKSNDYGKSEKEATSNAEILAIKTLLFNGISESEVNTPMITFEEANNQTTKDYINNLFNNDRYKAFLSCSETIESHQEKKTFHVKVKCCISYRLLRKDLEANNIIPKIGF
jgi:hypothetical protein